MQRQESNWHCLLYLFIFLGFSPLVVNNMWNDIVIFSVSLIIFRLTQCHRCSWFFWDPKILVIVIYIWTSQFGKICMRASQLLQPFAGSLTVFRNENVAWRMLGEKIEETNAILYSHFYGTMLKLSWTVNRE